MNQEQFQRMKEAKGFIAALDQSGGSTPKALRNYGVGEDQYKNEDEMFDLVHAMRTRIMTNPSFVNEKILGAILFKETMERQVEGKLTADYLWEEKQIIPFLKVDSGLAELNQGVQLMKPMPELNKLLDRAVERSIFGTKMRSVIKEYNEEGIKAIIAQQFEIGLQILEKGLVPILEPEVDIHAEDRAKIEGLVKEEILKGLDKLPEGKEVIFKLTIPEVENFYKEIIDHKKVVRVVALSGGFSRKDANEKLTKNKGLIASFSRALTEGLNVDQTDEEFTELLSSSIDSIYQASII